jgi:type IV secretory pathway VirB10-like protein
LRLRCHHSGTACPRSSSSHSTKAPSSVAPPGAVPPAQPPPPPPPPPAPEAAATNGPQDTEAMQGDPPRASLAFTNDDTAGYSSRVESKSKKQKEQCHCICMFASHIVPCDLRFPCRMFVNKTP